MPDNCHIVAMLLSSVTVISYMKWFVDWGDGLESVAAEDAAPSDPMLGGGTLVLMQEQDTIGARLIHCLELE